MAAGLPATPAHARRTGRRSCDPGTAHIAKDDLMKESKGKAKKVQPPKANASQPSLKTLPSTAAKPKK